MESLGFFYGNFGASEASVDCFQSGEREEFPFFEGVAKFS